jgi:lipocalin
MAETNEHTAKITIWIVVICIALFLLTHFSKKVEPTKNADNTSAQAFAGNDCTSDCSGHEAGYNWAEENGIQDEDDCDATEEHSNSPSFAEGCKAYVNDNSSPDDDDDQK